MNRRTAAISLAMGTFTLFIVICSFNCLANGQRVGAYEVAIDIPWRMQQYLRQGSDVLSLYGKIPIQISINDANAAILGGDCSIFNGASETLCSNEILSSLSLNTITVKEMDPLSGNVVSTRNYTLNDFHEIEKTVGTWRKLTNEDGLNSDGNADITRMICKRWKGEDCSGFQWHSTATTSEWHGVLYHQAIPRLPGQNARLQVTVNARVRTLGEQSTRVKSWTADLVTQYQPKLPKFGSTYAEQERWAYGDLHYHSQGTDNDGESGYSYAGTLHAMNAIGLDFVFATEHASNSLQITGLGLDINPFRAYDPVRLQIERNALRDMSYARWANHWKILNDEDGVNEPRNLMSYVRLRSPGKAQVPQIFLGGELDLVPETDSYSRYVGALPIGRFDVLSSCGIDEPASVTFFGCGLDTLLKPVWDNDEGYLGWIVKDIQGPGEITNARQHAIYLPSTSSNPRAGIMGNTTAYGGASRRLSEVIQTELENRQKGYMFLAHPTSATYSRGIGRLGPDLVPYSEKQLERAFKSQYVLGLQGWNEDNQFHNDIDEVFRLGSITNRTSDEYGNTNNAYRPYGWMGTWAHHNNLDTGTELSLEMWDLMLMWGINQNKTAGLDWLPLSTPRKVFFSGGSDAHGDFNHRREGYFFGLEKTTNTAIGKPRNLVYAGTPNGKSYTNEEGITGQAYSQEQVIDGLKTGKFLATNGPIVRLVVDENRNGEIDEDEPTMGDTYVPSDNGPFQLIVEWKSTPSMGKLDKINFHIGSHTDEYRYGARYAPAEKRYYRQGEHMISKITHIHNGAQYSIRHYGKGLDDLKTEFAHFVEPFFGNTPLQIIINKATEGYSGKRVLTFNPNDFPVPKIEKRSYNGIMKAVIVGSREPSTLYLRAEAYTENACDMKYRVNFRQDCEGRRAFTNPIWYNRGFGREFNTNPEDNYQY